MTKLWTVAALLPIVAALTAPAQQRAQSQAAPAAPRTDSAVTVDFARDIQPILAARCYACHGEQKHKAGLRLDHKSAALAGSSFGKVIEPGDSAQSSLIQRVIATDVDERMPLEKEALSARDIGLLRAWIDQGAVWPDDGSSLAAAAKHWAYVAPVQRTPPEVAGVGDPIDRFIRARLSSEGLEPSPPADRATLIRRVSLDLVGLPPTLAEVDAFVRDERADAYERAVDRLLASPRYGERRAQRWLDLARYADTNGYEKDERRTMWRYRDWVIDAFNRNMPFDQFTIEQLAGDLLPNATLDQRIATGFHRNTLMNEEGGTDPEEFRNAAVVDRVNTTASVWLGTTLACAQCHNHKFDPFSQKEYYQLFAYFDGTEDTGNKNDPMIPAPTPDQARREKELVVDVERLKKELAAPDRAMDEEEEAWVPLARAQLPPATEWRVLVPAEVGAASGAALSVLPDGSVLAGGKVPEREKYTVTALPPLGTDGRARADSLRIGVLRLEALSHESLPAKGPGRAGNGNFVLTGVSLEIVEGEKSVRVPFRAAEASFEQTFGGRYRIGTTIDGDPASGWAIDRRIGGTRDETALLVLDRPVEISTSAKLRITLACESPFADHAIGRFRLSVADDDALARSISPFAMGEMGAWRRVGPFFAKSQADALATVFPPEKEIVARGPLSGEYRVQAPSSAGTADAEAVASAPSNASPLTWSDHADWRDGDAHDLVGEKCAHYLVRTVHCDERVSLVLHLGADDALRAWIDGEPVFEAKEMQGAVADQHKLETQLAAGAHTIALKVVNGGGQYSFFFDAVRSGADHMSAEVAAALRAEKPDQAQRARVREYFRRTESARGRELHGKLARAEKVLADLRAEIPTALVMKEMKKPRRTRVHVRGSFLNPGEEVEPGVPRVLSAADVGSSGDPPGRADGAPRRPSKRPTRLELARWLVDPANPLTARVVVNRAWEDIFGRGIVATSDDFGTRGEPPSHPELLDWLAVELVRMKWDIQALTRLIVTSETYRQSSRVTPLMLERDPRNVWLARSPRMRMEIETLRDVSLSIGGLLDGSSDGAADDAHEADHADVIGGPSVMPPQPDGIWAAAYSGDQWKNAKDAGRYRRGLYTFWRRSSPYATYMLFDAPTRELACTRRARTNTPLQALALLNDPAFLECAAGLARRMLREESDSDARRIAHGFRLCTARDPSPDEIEVLATLRRNEHARLTGDPAAARSLIDACSAVSKREAAADPIELASWIAVGNVLLNLDETVTRN